jgi:hypothetical protein
MKIPKDSNLPPNFSHSVSDMIDSLARMLLGTSLSYEKESCQMLFERIKEKISFSPENKDSLDTLSRMLLNPSSFENVEVTQVLHSLKTLE